MKLISGLGLDIFSVRKTKTWYCHSYFKTEFFANFLRITFFQVQSNSCRFDFFPFPYLWLLFVSPFGWVCYIFFIYFDGEEIHSQNIRLIIQLYLKHLSDSSADKSLSYIVRVYSWSCIQYLSCSCCNIRFRMKF